MAVRRRREQGHIAALVVIITVHRYVFAGIAGSLAAAAVGLPLVAALLPGAAYLLSIVLVTDALLATAVHEARTPLAARLGDPEIAALPPLAYAGLGAAASPAYGRAYLPVAAGFILLAAAVAARSASVATPGLPAAAVVLGTVVAGLLAGPRLARLGAASLAPRAAVSLRAR
jgi:hypothetical protein